MYHGHSEYWNTQPQHCSWTLHGALIDSSGRKLVYNRVSAGDPRENMLTIWEGINCIHHVYAYHTHMKDGKQHITFGMYLSGTTA
jgi:hypothetical protein